MGSESKKGVMGSGFVVIVLFIRSAFFGYVIPMRQISL